MLYRRRVCRCGGFFREAAGIFLSLIHIWWYDERKALGNRLTEKLRTFGVQVMRPGYAGMAVSYTHLDVYKRQVYAQPKTSTFDAMTVAGENLSLTVNSITNNYLSNKMCIRDRRWSGCTFSLPTGTVW